MDVEGRNGGGREEGLPSIWCDLMAWIQKWISLQLKMQIHIICDFDTSWEFATKLILHALFHYHIYSPRRASLIRCKNLPNLCFPLICPFNTMGLQSRTVLCRTIVGHPYSEFKMAPRKQCGIVFVKAILNIQVLSAQVYLNLNWIII